MTIGKRIEKCRKEKNLSQEYLADRLNISRQAVSKWEKDLSCPDTKNLIGLAELLGVSVEYIACGDQGKIRKEIAPQEKKSSLFNLLGSVLIGVGLISFALGFITLWLLSVISVFFILFGTLLITLQKQGAVLSLIIFSTGIAFTFAAAFSSGLDVLVVWTITAASILLPLVCFAVTKIIKKLSRK